MKVLIRRPHTGVGDPEEALIEVLQRAHDFLSDEVVAVTLEVLERKVELAGVIRRRDQRAAAFVVLPRKTSGPASSLFL